MQEGFSCVKCKLFRCLLDGVHTKLSAAIQTRQQFEEHGASPPDTPVLDCEEEQDMEL